MKNNLLIILSVIVLASCSSPRYVDLGNPTRPQSTQKSSASSLTSQVPAVPVLLASASREPVVLAESVSTSSAAGKTYLQLSRAERKAVRNHVKTQIKSYLAGKKMDSSKSAQAGGMDKDLKLAIIFGAVGIVGLMISGDVFHIIGGIALIIGVVFFVKWIIRQ